jgi:hypothetical protein
MNSSASISDRASTIVDRLDAQARRQLRGRVHGFRLALRNGGLVVQGRADNYHAKQLATEAVKAATALPILANEIVVSQLVPALDRAHREEDRRNIGREW